jgi:cytochrome c biogenesis protein CcmG/thiol:disulfide interchange protein DsbE
MEESVTESLASTGGASSEDRRASATFSRRRLIYAAPTVGFGALAVLFASGLGRDPSLIPSALIGQAVPRFSLPPVQGRTLGLSSEDLLCEVSLVNVFASWCVACREEHPLLMRLSTGKQRKIHGLNYKDEPENAARWLNANGDPYTRIDADRDGRVAIDWGVYGVPETFVVGGDGRIAYKHIGPLSEETLERTILPLVARLRGKAGA